MFEHLVPKTKIRKKQDKTNLKKYLSFFLFSILVFIFVINISKGPSTDANESKFTTANVIADTRAKSVVAKTPKVAVFNFVIETKDSGVILKNLKIYTNGLYDANVFNGLKLYYHDVQLGNVSEVDDYGSIYFDALDYLLPAGQNELSFILDSDAVVTGDILQFSLEDKLSVVLEYDGHLFYPEGNFPILGGQVLFSDQGDISAYNNLNLKEQLLISNDSNLVASFGLTSNREMSDLKQIIINLDNDSDQIFMLVHDNQVVAEAKVNNQQIVFDLEQSLVLQTNSNLDLDIYVKNLELGEYNFSLEEIKAQGFISNLNLNLITSLNLSKLKVVPAILEFENSDLSNRLFAGWNEIYNLNITAKGESIKLNKLSWLVDTQDVDIADLELWVDNKAYFGGLALTGNKVIAELKQPIVVSGTKNIKLLVKVDNVKDTSVIKSYLLTDQEETNNIVWSVGDKINNGYLLPGLPLNPSVLTK